MKTITISAALLEKLAPEEPINQDEQGGCVWCGQGDLYADARPETHLSDCPWVEARKLLAELEK